MFDAFLGTSEKTSDADEVCDLKKLGDAGIRFAETTHASAAQPATRYKNKTCMKR